jgi:zinc protease
MKKILFALLISSTTFAQSISPQEVLEKYFTAIGGKENMSKVNTFYGVATTTVMGQSMETIESKKAPNKFSSIVDQGGVELAKVIFDGSKAQITQMGNTQLIEGDGAKAMLTQALIFPEQLYLEKDITLGSEPNEKHGDEDCYVISVTGIPGLTTVKEYYSISSGLKVKQAIDSPNGSVSVIFSDYKDYAPGIKFANKLVQEAMGMTIEKVYSEIQVNSTIADTDFEIK